MTKRKNIKAFTSLWPKIFKIKKTTKTKDVQWWLRAALVTSRQQLQGGFVLPTTVMVILVVVLVVTTLVFRSFNRTTQIIGERQQQVIYNAATPAIDRAKSKLENLFKNDQSLPSGVPSDGKMEEVLRKPVPTPGDANPKDTYTIEGDPNKGGEERLTFNTDPNAAGWYFTEKDNQGGVKRIVAYSINFKKQATNAGRTIRLQDPASDKAPVSVARNGPVTAINAGENPCGGEAVKLTANENDWEPISPSTLAKTFQVTAVAIDNPGRPNQTLTTLEFQQDRQADAGNKWGAYFRYDLELFNAPPFRWNGAMRSDGNMFLGSFNNPFRAYLISAPKSCVNLAARDSKISIGQYRNRAGNITFQGQVAAARLNLLEFKGSSQVDIFTSLGAKPTENQGLDTGKDSVSANLTNPGDLALDPVALFTQDTFKSRGRDSTSATYRDTAWDKNILEKRIRNESIIPPNLNDTYRADNRYGPNPTYDGKPLAESKFKIPTGNRVGDAILANDVLTRNTSPDPKDPEALGLDGYWERRAAKGGLRVVVGQRLELAGTLPAAAPPPAPDILPANRAHEFLQRRTQHNNLAAVQATAIYHYKNGAGSEAGLAPVACMATTVHPGTAETLKRSATFEQMNLGLPGGDTLVTDFFNGRGTNGWEFIPAAGAPSPQMMDALRNLANSSGDQDGAYPPSQTLPTPIAAGQVRPLPSRTRFGDFSNLRRALGLGSYNGLSIADRSYIDTAACSLGMLAYNVNYLESYAYPNTGNVLTNLNAAFGNITNGTAATDGNADNGEITISPAVGTTPATVNIQPARETAQTPLPPTITLPLPAALTLPAGTTALLKGTAATPVVSAFIAQISAKDKAEFYIGMLSAENKRLAQLITTKQQVEHSRWNGVHASAYSCNIPVAYGNLRSQLCIDPTITSPKYPLLARVFPKTTPLPPGILQVNTGSIQLQPRRPGTNWLVPRQEVTTQVTTVPGGGNSLPNSNVTNLNNLIRLNPAAVGGSPQYFQVAFKDAAMFNGREMMSKRILDIDLNLLRRTLGPGGDYWLPTNSSTDPNAPPPNGIVYAFREDAVREDGIARPPSGQPLLEKAMDARPGNPQDPNTATFNTAGNGISVKPVDYLADPDRRPNGFRLKNGSNLERPDKSTAGMSFISDNTVYIYGDFNLHSTDGTTNNILEEFTETLKEDWSNFYTRDKRNPAFAQTRTDTWRPTEVLGDSVSVLSANFCDGSIEDGIIYPGINPTVGGLNLPNQYGCDRRSEFTSYLNQNRPTVALTSNLLPLPTRALNNNAWVRENPYDPTSPIKISPTGKPLYATPNNPQQPYELLAVGGPVPETYLRFRDNDAVCGVLGGQRKCIGRAAETRVNSLIIQSIIPSRPGQSYGGFHNFPRLIENWRDINLHMAGSFMQLRFSTQATGPYDQDAWEPSLNPISSGSDHEQILYYDPARRRWGYDVALQYQTKSPVARRFGNPGDGRNEVYSEVPTNDPYVQRIIGATCQALPNVKIKGCPAN
jgi:hypothetical protein